MNPDKTWKISLQKRYSSIETKQIAKNINKVSKRLILNQIKAKITIHYHLSIAK